LRNMVVGNVVPMRPEPPPSTTLPHLPLPRLPTPRPAPPSVISLAAWRCGGQRSSPE
jgi:hypothetical protein